jgi:hypothetical protein
VVNFLPARIPITIVKKGTKDLITWLKLTETYCNDTFPIAMFRENIKENHRMYDRPLLSRSFRTKWPSHFCIVLSWPSLSSCFIRQNTYCVPRELHS